VTRGVAHPTELRAEVIAAVLAGMSIVQAAARYNLDKGLISRWVASVATDSRVRDAQVDLGERLLELIDQHVTTLCAQLQAAARPEWLEKQPAAELAQLVVAERDTVLRLLAGLRPTDDTQPQLGAPGASENA